MNKLYEITATVKFIINTNEKDIVADVNCLTPTNKNIIGLEVLDFDFEEKED